MPALREQVIALSPWPGRFWRWWSGELAALAPAGIRLPLSGGVRIDILPGWHAVELVRTTREVGERLVQDKPLDRFEEADWAELGDILDGARTRVLLQPPLIYICKLRLPKAARSRLASAVALQLRDHSPLEPRLIDWRIVDRRAEDDKLHIRVVIVRSSTLDAIASGFAEHALAPPPVYAVVEDAKPVLLRRGSRSSGRLSVISRPWWIALGLLLSTPLWILLALHLAVASERAQVGRLAQEAAPKLAAERRLETRASVAQALKAVLASPSVIETVDDLAARIPPPGHALQVAGSRDGSVSFTLVAKDPDAVAKALAHDPLLPGARTIEQAGNADGTVRIRYQTGPR